MMDKVLNHRDYNLALQPLPGGGGSKRDAAEAGATSSGLSKADRRLLTQAVSAQKKGSGKGKGEKSKGSKKGKDTKGPLPAELRIKGATAQDEDGNPICFGFNTAAGCSGAAPGGRCSKGRHVCAMFGCRKAHPMVGNHGSR